MINSKKKLSSNLRGIMCILALLICTCSDVKEHCGNYISIASGERCLPDPPQTQSYSLTTNVSPTGSGTVNRNPNQTTYDAGTEVTLTAAASSGYTFSYWSNGSTTATTTVKMDGNKTMTAAFIQAGSDPCAGNPTDNPNCPGYNPCTTSPGSTACCNTNTSHSSCQVTPTKYTLTTDVAPANSGTVSRNPNKTSYDAGEAVTLTAVPSTGYTFVSWSNGSTTATTTVKMDGNKTMTATFIQAGTDPCDVSPTLIPGCPGYDVCIAIPGSTACCTAQPYHTSCPTNPNPCAGLPSATPGSACCNHDDTYPGCYGQTVTATITVEPVCFNGSSCAGNTVTLNPPGGTYAVGTQVTLTAIPASGYKFENWSGGAAGRTNPITVIVSGNISIIAFFEVSGSTDPCAGTGAGSTACCASNPNHSSCQSSGGGACNYNGSVAYCQWDVGCFVLDSEYTGETCAQLIAFCQEYGILYTGVTNILDISNNYGEGVTCNGTAH